MKKLFITIALAALTTTVFAQPKNAFERDDLGTYDRVTVHGPYLTNRFVDNWFISVAGGVNLYFGTNDVKGDFGKRLAPAIDASIGKWITPSVGFRLQYAGLEARGFSSFASPYHYDNPDNGVYKEKWNLISGHADILYNMSNAWGGYRSDRLWNFVGFIGFGVAHSDKNGYKSNQFAPNFGLLNLINVGKRIDITLEARGLMVKNDFDKVDTKTMVEVNFSLTAGISIKLGETKFKRPIYVAPADYTPYQNRINSLENDLNNAKAAIDRLTRELEDCRNRPTTPVQVDSKCMATTISAFFPIGRATISDKDMVNIEHIAATIKANPNRKFLVTGYADSNTGTPAINQRLSDQRANNVADALVKFGVNRSQLVIDGKGGVHADTNPALYRVVVVEEQ